jgi:hypothetical protein
MPSFTPINDVNTNNSGQVVEELDMHEVNEYAVEHALAALAEPLDSVPKE